MEQRATDGKRASGIQRAAYYPMIVIGIALLSHGGFALSGQGFTPFYPFIQDDFDLSRTQIGFITAAIFGTASVTSSWFGWTIDRFGVRLVAGGTLMLSGLMVASLYFANSFFLLLVIAAAMGSLRPVGHPAGTKAIMDWVGSARRGTAMSVKQAGNPVLGALAAVAVPPIAVAYGWQVAAVALGAFIMLLGIIILVLYRDPPREKTEKKAHPSFFTGMGRVIRNRDISLAVAFGFPLIGTQVATVTYFILFLNDELGISVIVAGAMLAVLQVSNVVMRIGWGIITDVIGKGRRKRVLIVAVGGTALSLLWMAYLPEGAPLWMVVLAAIALGATATSWVTVHTVLLSEISEPGQIGITIGYASTVSRTGIVVAPPLLGFLADSASYRVAWLALVAAILVGLLLILVIHEPPAEER